MYDTTMRVAHIWENEKIERIKKAFIDVRKMHSMEALNPQKIYSVTLINVCNMWLFSIDHDPAVGDAIGTILEKYGL